MKSDCWIYKMADKMIFEIYTTLNLSFLTAQFFWRYGWSNSFQDTDPSAVISLPCFSFFIIVFMVFFPTGIFLY